jgi:hypothetical protein
MTKRPSRRTEDSSRDARAAKVCRATLSASLPGLVVQYLLGMYINLFLPRLHAQAPLIAHIALGSALIVTAAVATIAAIISRRLHYLVVSILGLISLALACSGGVRFLAQGQHSSDSYLMAVGFILATATYGVGLRTINRQLHRHELELARRAERVSERNARSSQGGVATDAR